MARVNIDDTIDNDPRIMLLKSVVGEITAWGSLVGAYRVAERYFVPDRKPIPANLFNILPWGKALLETGVAELTEDRTGVFIIYSEEQFSWRFAKSENGKKGGRPKTLVAEPESHRTKEEETQAKPEEAEISEANLSKPKKSEVKLSEPKQSDVKPLPLPLPLSLSLENTKTKKLKARDAPPVDAARFIGTYVKAFQSRYPAQEGRAPPRPCLFGKVQGQIKKYLEEVPIDRACELIQAYCQMDDPWFKTKCHDFTTFAENQNKICIALDTGEDSSQSSNRIDWSKVNLS